MARIIGHRAVRPQCPVLHGSPDQALHPVQSGGAQYLRRQRPSIWWWLGATRQTGSDGLAELLGSSHWTIGTSRVVPRERDNDTVAGSPDPQAGRQQGSKSNGITSERWRVSNARLPTLVKAMPNITSTTTANTRYGVRSITTGKLTTRLQLTTASMSNAVISSAGSNSATLPASISNGRVRVRTIATG